MFTDPIYWIIMIVCMALSGLAALFVKARFRQGQQVPLASGLTGAEIARRILHHEGITDVKVEEHQGFLSDHYNPGSKSLHLSPDVYHGSTAAAAGVAAHEVGHALQHAHGDITMWGRTILVYPAHFGQNFAPWIIIAGIMLAGGSALVPGSMAYMLAVGGVSLFGVASLCSIIIVFNEFNASKRARFALADMGITRPGEEDDAVRSVLTAAGLTYVAAAAAALLNLLYWAMIIFNQRSNEN
jgi:uncharacterized protein